MPFEEVKIKRKRQTSKVPKLAFLHVNENGEVRLKTGTWFKKVIGKKGRLLIDKIAGVIAVQGVDKKDNVLSTSGTMFNITDAIEEMNWNLTVDSWYQVPIEHTNENRRVSLRMRKAERMKEPPPVRKTGSGRKKKEE